MPFVWIGEDHAWCGPLVGLDYLAKALRRPASAHATGPAFMETTHPWPGFHPAEYPANHWNASTGPDLGGAAPEPLQTNANLTINENADSKALHDLEDWMDAPVLQDGYRPPPLALPQPLIWSLTIGVDTTGPTPFARP